MYKTFYKWHQSLRWENRSRKEGRQIPSPSHELLTPPDSRQLALRETKISEKKRRQEGQGKRRNGHNPPRALPSSRAPGPTGGFGVGQLDVSAALQAYCCYEGWQISSTKFSTPPLGSCKYSQINSTYPGRPRTAQWQR